MSEARPALITPDILRLWSAGARESLSLFFFFNDTATTEIYTLSLHDALPILQDGRQDDAGNAVELWRFREDEVDTDRKSTRLNSSHLVISYAVFCLKKKKKRLFLLLAHTIAMNHLDYPVYTTHTPLLISA